KNVCGMYDLGEAEGSHYITMEYVQGEDLKSMIRMSTGLTTGTVISLGKQVCEGLAEAHGLGVVHRDLKPQNIMIDKGGNAKIMDFGIARSLRERGITGPSVIIGTPEYMSPEQAEAREIDRTSDIYSLGVILYEMVTGRVPFEGETALGIVIKHKTETPKNPKQINPGIPDDLARLILKCLEKDKAMRYQSAAEVKAELDKIEKGIPTTERIIPERKPFTSREITVKFNLRRLLVPGLAAVALVILGLAVWKLIPRQKAAPVLAPTDKPSLAVMYFKNNTGDPALDHWRTALSDLLIADLAQSRYVRVLSGDRLFDILRQLDLVEAKSYTREELRKVSSQGRASHILLGDYTRAGENFRINTVLQEAATGELLGSESVDGKGAESLIFMVDDLTRRIKSNLRLSEDAIAGDIDEEVGRITTSSAEAYKYYNEGRDLHHRGRYRESIQSIERALALDPEFAMAYRSMAMAYNNLLMFSEKTKYLKKAFDLAGRLSEREHLLIQGEILRESEKTYGQAIEAYNRLLELYPDDTIGGTNLGVIHTEIEDWDQVIEIYQRLIRRGDQSIIPYTNQAEAYRHKGMYDRGRDVIELYIKSFGDSARLREDLAQHYFFQGRYEAAHEETQRALSLDPKSILSVINRGIIAHARGNLAEAERAYLEVLESDELGYHLYSRTLLGSLNLMKGRLGDATEEFERGLELAEKIGDNWWKCVFHTFAAFGNLGFGKTAEALRQSDVALDIAQKASVELRWQRRALLLKGLAQLGAGSVAESAQTADELKALVDEGMNKKEIRLYHHLRGMIEVQNKNFARAIEYFKEANGLLSHPADLMPFTNDQAIFTEALAQAYYSAGDLDKAQWEFEKIAGFSTGILYYGHIYARSLSMLGRIYEERGWKEKARGSYQKFLDLWKDADSGLAEVVDTRKRLASLGN
ncbi:MAG: protein kinase, partial [Candidatus Aminicenantes bacterium]|nr:protein kinase [Candidatus Aminicenantes bacterium]